MDYNKEKQTVTIFTKAYKLDVLATRLSGLNGSQVRSFFENRGMMLPRKFSCMALVSVLNERIKQLTSDKLKKDYFTRLQYYRTFSELQLLNLWEVISWAEDFKQLRINYWKLILINYVGLNLSDGEIQYLITLKKLPMESFDEYYDAINDISCEQANTFDGQDIEILKENLANSASAAEMQGYAEKYGLEVPQRLSKAQLAEYAYYQVKDDKRQPTDIKDKLEAMNVTQLNNFCKEWRIDMTSGMNKQQVVTYMFFYLSQCEILTTSLKTIESLPMYEPLEFKVDLSVATPFGAKEAKKIIYYESDEESSEDDSKEEQEEKPAAKAIVAKAVAPSIAKNAKRTEVKPDEADEAVFLEPKEETTEEKAQEAANLETDSKEVEAIAFEKHEEEKEEPVEKSDDPIVNAEIQKAFFYEVEQPEGEGRDNKESDLTKEDFEAASSVLENTDEPLDDSNEEIEDANDNIVDEDSVEEDSLDAEAFEEPALVTFEEEVEEPLQEEVIDEVAEEVYEDETQEEAFEETEEPVIEEASEEVDEDTIDDVPEELEDYVDETFEDNEQIPEQKLTLDEERLSIILKNFDIKKFADKKEEKVPKNAIPIGDVVENNKYGSKELLDLKKSKKGLVIGLIIGAVALIAAGIALWIFVFKR